ncbi:MAG TPA: TonB-dependent receptor plug domain-containing protein, partial [Polyangiaceae bacterium]|nr:TonB-dependent receptor plug domain-containing protein [Polyangiaceae bacterium]
MNHMARALRFRSLSLGISLWLTTGWVGAHEEVEAPRLLGEPYATWPSGHELSTDLVVPVVMLVNAEGAVESVELEASVGEPFDSAAREAALAFRFEPARDANGARAAKVRAIVRFVAVHSLSPPPLAAPLSATSNPSPAEDTPRPPLTPLAPDGERERTVTVRGQAPPRGASESELDRALLSAAPHRNASELLQTVPGVFVSQHSGEGKAHQIFLRGFDAVHGQDVEMWAGGAPINDVSNLHGQGYADAHFLIPELVLRLRSTPGNYDPRQGDFAVAGTLRFDLGYSEPGITAKASAGSFGARRFFMGYRPTQATDETFAAFELYKTDGFGPSRAARHATAMAQLRHELTSAVTTRVLVSAYAGRFDSPGVLRLRDIESKNVDPFATYDAKQGGSSARAQLVWEIERATDAEAANPNQPQEHWSVAPFLVFRSLNLRSNFTGTLRSPEGDSTQQLNRATTLGATASYTRSVNWFSRNDRLEAGLYLRSDRIHQTQHRLS